MKKSGNGRVALPGIRQTGKVVLFATALGWLMTQRAGRCSWTRRKAEVAV